jgi:hypothetical protein
MSSKPLVQSHRKTRVYLGAHHLNQSVLWVKALAKRISKNLKVILLSSLKLVAFGAMTIV